jgi:DNA-binding winged helix-turn-helix (wHTH) protein
MLYSLGSFVLDTKKEILYLKESKEIISKNTRVVHLLLCLAEAFPDAVDKMELTEKLWPDNDVTSWSLSRLTSTLRKQLAEYDSENEYIRTIHTKGFKLAIEPKIIDHFEPDIPSKPKPEISQQESDTSRPEEPAKKESVNPGLNKWIFGGLLVGVLALILSILHWLIRPDDYGSIDLARKIDFPVTSDWNVTSPGIIRYTSAGVEIESPNKEPLYVSVDVMGPAFFQGSIFSLGLEANQAFVEGDGGMLAYYVTQLDGRPGEWHCWVDHKMIAQLNFDYECHVDENGSYTKALDNEPVVFGLKVLNLAPGGLVKIKSARLQIPASISTDKGWKTTGGLPLHYERGVSYKPKTSAHQIATIIKGPLNIQGSKIAFTFYLDDSAKKSIVTLQFFILDKTNKWQECFVNMPDIDANVVTKICEFKYTKDPFVLNSEEQITVGVRPVGDNIKGEIKIIGATITQ